MDFFHGIYASKVSWSTWKPSSFSKIFPPSRLLFSAWITPEVWQFAPEKWWDWKTIRLPFGAQYWVIFPGLLLLNFQGVSRQTTVNRWFRNPVISWRGPNWYVVNILTWLASVFVTMFSCTNKCMYIYIYIHMINVSLCDVIFCTKDMYTLQETNISHLGKKTPSSKVTWEGICLFPGGYIWYIYIYLMVFFPRNEFLKHAGFFT